MSNVAAFHMDKNCNDYSIVVKLFLAGDSIQAQCTLFEMLFLFDDVFPTQVKDLCKMYLYLYRNKICDQNEACVLVTMI